MKQSHGSLGRDLVAVAKMTVFLAGNSLRAHCFTILAWWQDCQWIVSLGLQLAGVADYAIGCYKYIDGLVQTCSDSIANALGLLQVCTEPSILWGFLTGSEWWQCYDVLLAYITSGNFKALYRPLTANNKTTTTTELPYTNGVYRMISFTIFPTEIFH